ncbi:MAG: stage II sporulation protein R [Firmicutes bacterium]|nr:stage II sporulation protein R [Bacillota bacterium]
MRKTIIILFLILGLYYIIGLKSESILKIPDNAIRFRVIANSNSDYDKEIKYKVRDDVQKYMSNILQNVDEINMSRDIISQNLDEIEQRISKTLSRESYILPYKVNFGLNYFPTKEYKGITYDAGYYESLVITLGSGEGDNWWCVLFPPLCLLEAEEGTEVEYTSFVKEILDKYV